VLTNLVVEGNAVISANNSVVEDNGVRSSSLLVN
jgi:hypothetical protein